MYSFTSIIKSLLGLVSRRFKKLLELIYRRFDSSGNEVDGSPLETFGSANLDNSPNSYYAEVAEKRAMSRIVLKLAGMYEYGVFGQDEFKDASGDEVKTARYKS